MGTNGVGVTEFIGIEERLLMHTKFIGINAKRLGTRNGVEKEEGQTGFQRNKPDLANY